MEILLLIIASIAVLLQERAWKVFTDDISEKDNLENERKENIT